MIKFQRRVVHERKLMLRYCIVLQRWLWWFVDWFSTNFSIPFAANITLLYTLVRFKEYKGNITTCYSEMCFWIDNESAKLWLLGISYFLRRKTFKGFFCNNLECISVQYSKLNSEWNETLFVWWNLSKNVRPCRQVWVISLKRAQTKWTVA